LHPSFQRLFRHVSERPRHVGVRNLALQDLRRGQVPKAGHAPALDLSTLDRGILKPSRRCSIPPPMPPGGLVYGSAPLYLGDARGTTLASAARQTAVYTEHGNLRARRGARLLSRWSAGTPFIYTRGYQPEGERGQNGADYNHSLAKEGGGSRDVIAGDGNLTIENLVQWTRNLPEEGPAFGPSKPSTAESPSPPSPEEPPGIQTGSNSYKHENLLCLAL
jgi:hypothetical protein